MANLKPLHAIDRDDADPHTGTVRFVTLCGETVPPNRAIERGNLTDLIRPGTSPMEGEKQRPLCQECLAAA